MTEIRQSYFLANLSLEELNRVLIRLADRLDELEGRRGTPRFKSSAIFEQDIDAQNAMINQAATIGGNATIQGTTTTQALTAQGAASFQEIANFVKAVVMEATLDMSLTKIKNVDNGTDDKDAVNISQLLAASWPIGSIFFTLTNTNPATILNFGTWATVGTGFLEIGDGWDGAGLVVLGGQGNLKDPAKFTLYTWQRTA